MTRVLRISSDLEQARKTIEQDQATIARLDPKIESIEKRMFWLSLTSPIALILGIATSRFLK